MEDTADQRYLSKKGIPQMGSETVKTAKFDADFADSDSHNYINESESYSAEDIKDEGLGGEETLSPFERLRNSAADALRQRVGWVFLMDIVLLVLALCCWNVNIQVKKSVESDAVSISARNALFVCSLCVFIFILLNFVLFKLSFFGLKRSNNLNTFFYYTNELSEHISIGIILIMGFVVVSLKDLDYCIYNEQNLKLFLSDILNCTLIATFMLSVVKVSHKAISMNFNYSVYIRRIRKVLLEDAFINLLSIMDIRNRRTDKPKLTGSQEIAHRNDAVSTINEYLADLYSYSEATDDLDLPRKRVLLKEFQRLMRRPGVGRGGIIQAPQKLRNKAASKAGKIVGRDGSIGPMSDLSLYFYKPEIFRFLMKEIGITEAYKFSRGSLTEFIERTYRERHLLKENLEHMNSAIDKVAFAFKVIIGGLLLVMLYIRAGGQGATTTGIISAFFGTQFISNSFSASVISSIIFLFFIHPYDIGDRVFVVFDGVEENLVVSELNVFSTVFYRWDGTYITILNTVLAQRPIRNVRRSGIMAESHKIQINSRTNQKKLVRLKELIEDFVKNNPEDYTEYIMVNHDYIEDASKLHMKVYMQYKNSWQNFELYLKRKTRFLSFLNRALQELDIEYILPPRRIALKNRSQ